jgi:hypothetical protein
MFPLCDETLISLSSEQEGGEMVISNPHEITQEKLSPGEVKFLKQMAAIDPAPFHRYEGGMEGLSGALFSWLRSTEAQRWPAGGRKIYRRIMSFAAEHDMDDGGFIRIAIYAGQSPHLSLAGIAIPPTSGLVFDITNQIVHRGWMHGEDKFAGAELKIPLGVQVVCQHMAHPVYEDWVGMGAPPEVVTSITEKQIQRSVDFDAAQRPKATPSPQLVPA